MQIAVVSDSHGRLSTVRRALALLEGRSVDIVIHCGDIDDEDTVTLFPASTHFVFGNCDFDRQTIRQAVEQCGAKLHEPFGRLELAGQTLAFIHGDDKRLLTDLETSQKYDFLFYGHTHQAMEHRTGKTRVINPGALYRARPKTFAILDLKTGVLESVVVEEE
ncbi:MAG: YfcE family phosphodiesterase [Planctomycetes bacterium]|nr:YfcE family phosphodiesterase [Planctomycetota bacterium]